MLNVCFNLELWASCMLLCPEAELGHSVPCSIKHPGGLMNSDVAGLLGLHCCNEALALKPADYK